MADRVKWRHGGKIPMNDPATATEFAQLPPTLRAERRGEIAVLTLARPEKRNALDDPTVRGIEMFFSSLPEDIRAVVLHGDGDHFSAGLDLAELAERDAFAGVMHSNSWHRAFERIEFGAVPVVAVLHGAVIGGGGAVRLPSLIGTARVMDMMLTGRTLGAEEGHAIGLTQYLVDDGAGLAKGLELAHRIAGNTPFTNYAVTHLLPRIARSDPATGLATEALAAAIAQGDEEAKVRLQAFLQKRGPKVTHN
jgi:enoyl-CoA hydratase/carnithine racemase